MSLSIGIVGLPNVGKSTLFNALLKKQQALAANYPFATIEPNVGIVPVPDERLGKLAEVTQAEEKMDRLPPLVPATVMFTDIAGIVKGAAQGEGLGNKFLSHIREADAIVMVLRAFADEDVVLTGSGKTDEDREMLITELVLADMQTIEKQVAPKGKVLPAVMKRWQVIERLRQGFDEGKRADSIVVDDEERTLVHELCLMSMKPIIYAINVDEAELSSVTTEILVDKYANLIGVDRNQVVIVSAKIEAELASMNELEQREYLESMGVMESGLERLIRVGYQTLGLQSFLTAGEKEVRAWTIPSGALAVEAAGVIHTDFMKKFIKAEVVHFDDFVNLGGWKGAREAGKARQEGRDYLMKDGDVVEFKIGA
jgi:GTP-binding protein YchF